MVDADRMTPQAEVMWLDGLEKLPAKVVVVFTTNNLHKLTDRFIRRCEVQRFDATSDEFRDGMVDVVRQVWKWETGTDLDTIPQDLGKFEKAGDEYSIGLALQQIAIYLRTGDPLPASFAVPIIREESKPKLAAVRLWFSQTNWFLCRRLPASPTRLAPLSAGSRRHRNLYVFTFAAKRGRHADPNWGGGTDRATTWLVVAVGILGHRLPGVLDWLCCLRFRVAEYRHADPTDFGCSGTERH
jgi:hypothetical protein